LKTSTRLPVFVLPLLACTLLVCARSPAGGRQQPAAGAVVFAVSKYEAEVTAEPVVAYRGGKFESVPADGEEGTTRSFVRDYFKAGRKYRIVSGGGEAGTLTISKYREPPGCVELLADATAETPARLGGRIKALATDSQTLGRGPVSRRAPTDAERARAVELARAAYAKNGVAAALAAKMEVVNLTATDLDRDGRAELIGSFRTERKGATPEAYTLFLIMEPSGDAFKTAWEWFHKGYEDGYEDRHFVEQVDFDGDGVGEVVAEGTYYESYDYVIYQRQQGRWRPVYKGGGGGC
jgi:hypothetical protein